MSVPTPSFKNTIDYSRISPARDPALRHRGLYQDRLDIHLRHCSRFHDPRGAVDPAPFLMKRLASPEILMCAFDDLVWRGDRAAGPDGMHLEDFYLEEGFNICRTLGSEIADGTYRPGPTRSVEIPKANGGVRRLIIQNGFDRLVSRATHLVLTPVVDPTFDPNTFGRVRMGVDVALASALAQAQRDDTWVWATSDVADAFGVIPRKRLLDACSVYLPPDVVRFIGTLIGNKSGRGIGQGPPLSPLLLNIFMNHFLDQPWRLAHPEVIKARYLDDLLLLCPDAPSASRLQANLHRRLRSIGTPAKLTGGGIYDLAAGDTVTWLGYEIGLRDGQPQITICEKSWSSLDEIVGEAAVNFSTGSMVSSAISSWFAWLGPTFGSYSTEQRREIADRALSTAAAKSFLDVVSPEKLLQQWSVAHARWSDVRRDIGFALDKSASS